MELYNFIIQVFISETWFFKADQIPRAKNYTFVTKNREEIHKRAKVGSRGVGILIKDSILNYFQVYEIVEQYDSVLCVVLKHKVKNYKLGIVAGYLPPENTKYGCDPDKFFEIQTQLAYMYSDCDDLVFGGDLMPALVTSRIV